MRTSQGSLPDLSSEGLTERLRLPTLTSVGPLWALITPSPCASVHAPPNDQRNTNPNQCRAAHSMVECSVPFFPQRHATRALPVSTLPRESAAPPVALSTLRRRWADVATRAGTGLSWDGRRRSRSKKSMADGDGKYDEQRSHRLAFVGVFQLLKERHEGPVLREMFECLAIALHARRPQAAPQWRRTEERQAFRRSFAAL
jgi:hypothetical protein